MLNFTSSLVNVYIDGDSNNASSQLQNVADKLYSQLAALYPLNGAITVKNLAKGGATFKTMLTGSDNSGIAEVNAAYESGKANILIVNGFFNGAAIGGTMASELADCKAYIKAVHTAHPDVRVLLMTTTAGKDDGGVGYNTVIDECNAYIRKYYKRLGAEALIEIRPPGGVFDYHPPYTYSETTFVKSQRYIDDVHWSPTGVAVVAQYIADTLAALPNVAPRLPMGTGNMLLGGF